VRVAVSVDRKALSRPATETTRIVVCNAKQNKLFNISIANTPEPPYYAVIFTSIRTAGDNGYDQMGKRMVELTQQHEGYLGHESVGDNSFLLGKS